MISTFILFSDRVIGRRNIPYTKVTKPNIYRVAIGEVKPQSKELVRGPLELVQHFRL